MIPKVRTWCVTVKSSGIKIHIDTINKRMARLIFRQDYIQYWGEDITISCKFKA